MAEPETPTIEEPPTTAEDERVTSFLTTIANLKPVESAEIDHVFRDDLLREYGTDEALPVEALDGMDYAQHVKDFIETATEYGLTVSVDSELYALDLPHDGRLIMNLYPKVESTPVSAFVFFEIDGTVDLQVNVLDDTVHDGPYDQYDLATALATVDEHRPFVSGRMNELIRAGANRSHARVVALRELGYSNADIADKLDLSIGAVGSYVSKFNNQLEDAEHLLVARTGAPKRVLAKHDFEATSVLRETVYICERILTRSAMAEVEYPYSVITVTEDIDSSSGSQISMTTTTYTSLRNLIHSLMEEETDTERLTDLQHLITRIEPDQLENALGDELQQELQPSAVSD